MTVGVRGIPYDIVEVAMRLVEEECGGGGGGGGGGSCEESGILFTGPNDVKTYHHTIMSLIIIMYIQDCYLDPGIFY